MGTPESTPQEIFGKTLEMVAGQAFLAAGYTLQNNSTHQSRGLYRYRKALANGAVAYIEFQFLDYQTGGLSRFRVNLLRNTGSDARSGSNDPNRVDKTLSKLLWDDFGVRQLDGPDHWWLFKNPQELGHALFEAGKLVAAFGIPWLEGSLHPGDDDKDQDIKGTTTYSSN